ncbi:putative ribonuclease H-like domain-containing protein [Tanacetum coccineum]
MEGICTELKNLIASSMSTRTKVGLGFQELFGVDEVFDLSTPSVFYRTLLRRAHTSLTLRKHSDKSSDSETHASCDSSLKTQTKDIPPAVDIQTLPELIASVLCWFSRNSSASVSLIDLICASRNRPAGTMGTAVKDLSRFTLGGIHGEKTTILGGDPSTDNEIGIVDSGCSKKGIFTNPHNKTPYELISGRFLRLSHLKSFCGVHSENLTLNAGTQDHDSDSEVDEQVIVIPSFPSNKFADPSSSNGPRQTSRILCQAEAEIRDQGVSAGVDSAVKDPAGVDSAVKDSAGIDSADSDPAVSNPADSFPPAGRVETYDESHPVCSLFTADFHPVYADESTLPPGLFFKTIGSSEKQYTIPHAVEVNTVPTKRVNTISSSSLRSWTNHTEQLHCLSACFLSQLEPTSIAKALEDPDWVDAMQEEMQQFINQQVWKLVPLPVGKHAIGTKWILKNKRDARGIVVRNKARLVAQGHRQEEGIDYDESICTSGRNRRLQTVFAFAFIIWAFWFMWMTIFGSTNKGLFCDEFEVLMKGEFENECYGRDDICFFGHYSAWFQTSSFSTGFSSDAVKKIFKDLKGQPKLGLCTLRFSISVGCFTVTVIMLVLIGDRKSLQWDVNFWAEGSLDSEPGCWIMVSNFMKYHNIFIDNQSTICIVKNPVFHQRTKHIEIRHHFIRDANEKNLIQVLKIHTDDNVADLLTKAFDGPRFAYLVVHIGMVNPSFVKLVSAGCTMVLMVIAGSYLSCWTIGFCWLYYDSAGSYLSCWTIVIFPAGRLVSAGCTMILLVVIFPAGRLVSAGCTMVLLVVIFPAGRLVSAGCTMVLLVVIFPAGRLVSAGCTMVLLVVIFPAGRLVSAGCTMVLLEVIVPAGFFVPAGSYGLCCW